MHGQFDFYVRATSDECHLESPPESTFRRAEHEALVSKVGLSKGFPDKPKFVKPLPDLQKKLLDAAQQRFNRDSDQYQTHQSLDRHDKRFAQHLLDTLGHDQQQAKCDRYFTQDHR